MKKVLTTDPNGLIGRHLITSPKARGCNITSLVSDHKDIHPEWDDNVKLQWDIT
jgi:hypothetical protein